MSEWKSGNVGIDLRNVLNVLATALYGNDPKCALRENLQNAHDACVDWVLQDGDSFNAEIHVIIDHNSRATGADGRETPRPSLIIRDTGVGMNEHDIRHHLATIGGTTKSQIDEIRSAASGVQRQLAEERIGRFGLGFLAGFIVADRIEVRSRKEDHPGVEAVFTADTEFKYRTASDIPERGTEVRLFLLDRYANPAGEDRTQCLVNSDTLEAVIRQYCDLLRFPFFVHRDAGRDTVAKPVTRNRPPWLIDEPRESEYRSFLKARMPSANDPLAVIPINVHTSVDAGGQPVEVKAHGVVYIPEPPRNEYQEYGKTELYVKRMFIMEDREQLLPQWSCRFCNAVVDTSSLTVTLDRNDVVRQDRAYFKLREEIGRQIIDGLKRLAERKEADFRDLISRHDRHIREAALILENDQPSTFFMELADHLPVMVVSRDYPPPGALMSFRKYLDDVAEPQKMNADRKVVRYFSHMSRQMLQNMISQDRSAVIDATDDLHRRFVEAYCVTHPDKVIVQNIGDDQLADYVTDVSPQEAQRWQAFCAYFKSLTHQGDMVDPQVKNFEPEQVPAIMLEVSAEAAEDERKGLAEFLSKVGGSGPVGRAVTERLAKLPPAGQKELQYKLFLNARNPLMLNLLRTFEQSGSTRLPNLVELILHEILHNARVYAGIPNSVEMTIHMFEHHSQLLDRLLQSHDRITNLERQQTDFSGERTRLSHELQSTAQQLQEASQELQEVKEHLALAIRNADHQGFPSGLPKEIESRYSRPDSR
jgi:HSP90 family molecular chaperone